MRLLHIYLMLFPISLFAQTNASLTVNELNSYPYFSYATTFEVTDSIYIALEPSLYSYSSDVDVYVTSHKTNSEWLANLSLTDVRSSGFQTQSFSNVDIQTNSLLIVTPGLLSGVNNELIGNGYDVVIDVNQNGELDQGDIIDAKDSVAGFYVVDDFSVNGVHNVQSTDNNGGQWLQQRFYYPDNISSLNELPLLVIAHGYTYTNDVFDYIGNHLASYGYIVAAIDNNTANGLENGTQQSSIDIIENIDYIFDNQSTILGGVLNGHIDMNKLALMGHSTGGEAVVRAYKRLESGETTSNFITEENIDLVISLAPVAFLDGSQSNTETANYALFAGGADLDASGFPTDYYMQTFSLFERSEGNRHAFYLHGVGHNGFVDNGLGAFADGPDLLPISDVNDLVKTYVLALLDYYIKDNYAGIDYLKYGIDHSKPLGVSDSVQMSVEYRSLLDGNVYVVDDFQSQPSVNTSSSSYSVSNTLESIGEYLMEDQDGSLEWDGSQMTNGLTRSRWSDNPRCAILTFDSNSELTYQLAGQNFSNYKSLSMRIAQMTRHPKTLSLNDDLKFTLKLTDVNGNSSSVQSSILNQKIRSPYARSAGGYLDLCLPDGNYTAVSVGGYLPSQQEYSIPGYVSSQSGVGSTPFNISTGLPCTNILVELTSSWCEGWYGGHLEIQDALGNVVGTTTLSAGCGPDYGVGWQSEFQTIHFNLKEFLHNQTNINLAELSSLSIQFGSSYGSAQGAIAIDDIMFNYFSNSQTILHITENDIEMNLFPNPTNTFINCYEKGKKKIYNLLGHIIWEGDGTQIDVSGFSNGVYILETEYGYWKFVKE